MQDNRTRAPNRRAALVTTGALGLGLGMSLAGCGGGNTEADEDPPVAPTLTISSDTPGVAAAAFTVNFRFSAGASGFGTDKLVVSGGSIVGGSFTTSSSSEYTMTVQPTANRVGLVEISVAAGGFRDSTGATASTRAYSFVQACNTVLPANEPVLTITDNVAGGARATGAVVFALTFSLAIRDTFSLANIMVAGGTASGFIRVSGLVYNVTLTPPAGTTGSMLLRVPVGAYTGEASNLANTVETLAGVAFQTA
ncbi:MAG: Ig-like domain-containing protein [Pseudomonadota bacterium]